MRDPVDALYALAKRLADPVDPLGRAMHAAVMSDGALSAPMATWALRTTCARYTREALESLARGTDTGIRTAGTVAVRLASSVAIAPLRAIALPLLDGAAHVLVRPSRSQRAVTSLLIRAMAEGGLCVQAMDEPLVPFVPWALSHGANALVAYGTDETLEALRTQVPAGVTFEGYGHGMGVSLVFTHGSGPVDEDAARAVALDIAHHDQSGCLSPQCVLIETDDPRPFARALHEALNALEHTLPRGPIDQGTASMIHQWQGALAAQSDAFHRGRTHSVAALHTPRTMGSPGGRNIAVTAVESRDAMRGVLAPIAAHLTCVGVSCETIARAVRVLPPGARARVVAAGSMQDPPLDGPEDLRRAAHRVD